MITQRTKRMLALAAVASILITAMALWNQRFPKKARSLEPLIQELADVRARTGTYPTNILSLGSARSIAARHTLYFGERTETNLMWNADNVSSHDLTVLVSTNYFVIFAPTGRIKPISFSSFPVWRFTSDGLNWVRGKIHWSLLGAYWSND